MPSPTPSATKARKATLTEDELRRIDAYWRASLYLCAGMIFLRDNPLLREPLQLAHIKRRLLGHWGSDPGQALVRAYLNRLIKRHDLNMIYISGVGCRNSIVPSNAPQSALDRLR